MLISFILNCLIFILVLFSLIAMFFDWNFMGIKGNLERPGMGMFCYFTIDSNVFAGICCFIMAIAELRVLTGRSAALSSCIYTLKLMGSSAVLLTFLVTFCFLMPQFKNPLSLLYNSNLFFHMIVPLLAGLSFVFLESPSNLPWKASLLGTIPTFFYAAYYMYNVFTHLQDGKPDKHYDFYNFLGGDLRRTPVVLIVILLVSYLLSLLLWFTNSIL